MTGTIIFWVWSPLGPEKMRVGFGVARRAVLMATTALIILLLLTLLALGTSFPSLPAAVLGALFPVLSLILINRPTSSYRYYLLDEQFRVAEILGRQRPPELGNSSPKWVGFRGNQLRPRKSRKGPA